MHVHIDCARAFVYMCVCVRCGRLYCLWNDMAINKPLDACIDSLGKSMLLTLWASELTPDWSTSLPLQVR